jgi:maleylacetate reductase
VIAFDYRSLPYNVLFHEGALARLPEEVRRVGSKALVLCTREQRSTGQQAVEALGEIAIGLFDQAEMHVPIEVAVRARETAKGLSADVCVAIGGGSTIGLGKAIALVSEIPIIAVPTTYAGSEMTPIWGITADGLKKTGRDVKVLPRTVIYDPALTLTLPASLSATSGINALAHCAEALYAKDTNPVLQLMAEEGIRALAGSLPKIAEIPDDMPARTEAFYGAWLAGTCLGAAGVALHHKICHTLGGMCNLPHAETHTIVLPHALAYNARFAPEAMVRIARAMRVEDAPRGVYRLAKAVGARTALKDLGMSEADIDRVAAAAIENPYWNPAPITEAGIRSLLHDAFHGLEPAQTVRPA